MWRAKFPFMRRGDNDLAVVTGNPHQMKFLGTFSSVILGRSTIQNGRLTDRVTCSFVLLFTNTYWRLIPHQALCSGVRLPSVSSALGASERKEMPWPEENPLPPQGYQLGREGRMRKGRHRESVPLGKLWRQKIMEILWQTGSFRTEEVCTPSPGNFPEKPVCESRRWAEGGIQVGELGHPPSMVWAE